MATTDLLIEDRHFRRAWSGPFEIGRRAAAQNLADVAAMGAVPTGLLIGFGTPADLPVAWAEALADGLHAECAVPGAAVIGGDIVGCDRLVIAVTALGDLQGRDPVTRDGARPGDVVAVAGRLGYAAAGLALLTAGRDEPAEPVDVYRCPRPPYEQGPVAARSGATAMLDVSDGLLADLGHLATASGVWIALDGRRLVPGATLRAAAGALRVVTDPRSWVLTGGEDHALVATFPSHVDLPEPWEVVGDVRRGDGVTVDGVAVQNGGWEHFT